MARTFWFYGLTCVAGCFSDPERIENKFPKESALGEVSLIPVGDVGDEADVPAAPPCGCTPAAGTWYRFTQLKVTSLDTASTTVVDALNTLWSADMAGKELNILFRLDGVDGGVMKLTAYSGARIPGATPEADTVCFVESSEFQTQLTASTCTYGPAVDVGLKVYSGTPTQPKNCAAGGDGPHVIPVSKVALVAVHTAVCDSSDGDYLDGQLEGSITQSILGDLCTCVTASDDCDSPDPAYEGSGGTCAGCSGSFTSLKNILVGLNGGSDLAYECKDADGASAACLGATFRASAMSVSPAACPTE